MVRIISPHIDDAVLSLGGLIRRFGDQGVLVHVHNVFSISNWVNPERIAIYKTFEEDYDLITSVRKTEEKIVAGTMRYTFDFWDFLDAPIRPDGEDYERQLRIQIEEKIWSSIDAEGAVFFPLGRGHEDHRILYEIGISLLNKGKNIIFYEDLPYAASIADDLDYQFNTASLKIDGFRPILNSFPIAPKISALMMYESQMSYEWLRSVKNYAYSLGDDKFFERFWMSKNNEFNFTL